MNAFNCIFANTYGCVKLPKKWIAAAIPVALLICVAGLLPVDAQGRTLAVETQIKTTRSSLSARVQGLSRKAPVASRVRAPRGAFAKECEGRTDLQSDTRSNCFRENVCGFGTVGGSAAAWDAHETWHKQAVTDFYQRKVALMRASDAPLAVAIAELVNFEAERSAVIERRERKDSNAEAEAKQMFEIATAIMLKKLVDLGKDSNDPAVLSLAAHICAIYSEPTCVRRLNKRWAELDAENAAAQLALIPFPFEREPEHLAQRLIAAAQTSRYQTYSDVWWRILNDMNPAREPYEHAWNAQIALVMGGRIFDPLSPVHYSVVCTSEQIAANSLVNDACEKLVHLAKNGDKSYHSMLNLAYERSRYLDDEFVSEVKLIQKASRMLINEVFPLSQKRSRTWLTCEHVSEAAAQLRMHLDGEYLSLQSMLRARNQTPEQVMVDIEKQALEWAQRNPPPPHIHR
jgi:hypothetical protein